MFLVAGILIGFIDRSPMTASPAWLTGFADTALMAILFTDGLHTNFQTMRRMKKLAGLTLFVGLPLTILFIAMSCHWVFDMPWAQCALVGALLAPTDPVFASALIREENIPQQLRHLLNMESGLNDGLALPIVLGVLGYLDPGHTHSSLLLNLGGGILLGPLVTWVLLWILDVKYFGLDPLYGRLFSLSVFLIVLGLCTFLNVNVFLALFLSGMLIATRQPRLAEEFESLGLPVAELLKLMSILLFGAFFGRHLLFSESGPYFLVAGLILFLVRPLALGLVLFRSPFSFPERVAASWFGPRGFASVVFSLQILKWDFPYQRQILLITFLTIVGSIFLHTSTDVPVSRWLLRKKNPRWRQIIGL